MGKRKAASISQSDEPVANDVASKVDIIQEANALSCKDFSDKYWNSNENVVDIRESMGFEVDLTPTSNLTEAQISRCFQLIEHTSRQDYEPSSFGWHPKRKMREMNEKDMKYIQAFKVQDLQFMGFLSCMLTYDSTPVVPVLYIYEIHLKDEARGKGLGKRLVEFAEHIAQKVGVDKVMLTCFKSNAKAFAFYKHLGYTVDPSSPEDRRTRNKVVKTDYVIMSKIMASEQESAKGAVTSAQAGQEIVRRATEAGENQLTPFFSEDAFQDGESYADHMKLITWAHDEPQMRKPFDDIEKALTCVLRTGKSTLLHAVDHWSSAKSDRRTTLNSTEAFFTIVRGLADRFDAAKDLALKIRNMLDSLRGGCEEIRGFTGESDTLESVSERLDGIDEFFNTIPQDVRVRLTEEDALRESKLTAREDKVLQRELECDRRAKQLNERHESIRRQGDAAQRATCFLRMREDAAAQKEARNARREADMSQREADMSRRERDLRHESIMIDQAHELLALELVKFLKTRNDEQEDEEESDDESEEDEEGEDEEDFEEESDEESDEEENEYDAESDEVMDNHGISDRQDKGALGRHLREHNGAQGPVWDRFFATAQDKHEQDEHADEHADEHEPVESDNYADDSEQGLTTVRGKSIFDLPQPETFKYEQPTKDIVGTWLRRSGVVRDTFRHGR